MEDIKRLLAYPFDSALILKKKKSIKKALLEQSCLTEKKIAVLGGSTTDEVVNVLELFLLYHKIKPEFYQCEYGRYYEVAVFDNKELKAFAPDFIYIHTSNKNITEFPDINSSPDEIDSLFTAQINKFKTVWESLRYFNCPIIQNNFEALSYRVMGNKDISDIHGGLYFINRLNNEIYNYARENKGFYVNDINYLASYYGLEKWSDPIFWHMYKYALNIDAIPLLCHNTANIIKSLMGQNKKLIALDLDNTLWGGVVGEVGSDNIEIGNESPQGQAYLAFQKYLQKLKSMGVLLAVCSKNEHENAVAGLSNRENLLHPADFVRIEANWENKDQNIRQIAKEINLLHQSIVFIDDNPAERELVRENLPDVAVPDIGNVEDYIKILDMSGFFEVTEFSGEDLERTKQYKENILRQDQEKKYENYRDYLLSLEMKAETREFTAKDINRITQLVNKTNQFNLAGKKFTDIQLEGMMKDEKNYITLCGRLSDKFGDNGLVSVMAGEINKREVRVTLWVMSCRVFKRDMELAMFDAFVRRCLDKGIGLIKGQYIRTEKNTYVECLYRDLGFKPADGDETGSLWLYKVDADYVNKNNVINAINVEENIKGAGDIDGEK